MVLTRLTRRRNGRPGLVAAALALAGFAGLAHGGESLYQARTNQQPLTLTCEQFARGRPSALWLRISGCSVDDAAGYRESGGRLSELFLLMRPASQPPGAPVALVIATSDPGALAAAEATIGNHQQPSQEAYTQMMQRIVTSLNAAAGIEGYVRSGAIEKFRTRRSLAGLRALLAPDFVALDLHAKPSVVRPAIEVGIGLALLAVALFWRSRRAAPAAAEEEPPTPGAVAGPNAAPQPSRIPPMLLLNLGPTAGPADLESAPPLGSRADVLQRLKAVLGESGGEADGRVKVHGSNWSLTLEVGQEDPIWTITIEALGDDSTDVLVRLARETGWRIFMPKLGRFIDPAAVGDVSSRRSARSWAAAPARID
jgi:hypothetical protein